MKQFKFSKLSLLVSAATLALAGCGGGNDGAIDYSASMKADATGTPYTLVTGQVGTLTPAGGTDTWSTPAAKALGITLIAQLDSSGPDAWDASTHPLVYVSSQGPTYGSKNPAPGVVLIDANTRQPIASGYYKFAGVVDGSYAENHGLAVSPDGKWIYTQSNAPASLAPNTGGTVVLVINARTLKIDKILQTRMHHGKTIYDANTKKGLVLLDGSTLNVYTLDPSDDNRVAGGLDPANFAAVAYAAFGDPSGKYMLVTTSLGFNGGFGGVSVVSLADYKVKARIGTNSQIPTLMTFSGDGKTAYVTGRGGADPLTRIDISSALVSDWKVTGFANAAVGYAYGATMSWDDKRIFITEKGNPGGNLIGDSVGIVNAAGFVDPLKYGGSGGAQGVLYLGGCQQPDHAIVHPDPAKNEMWVSCNSSFDNAVVGMGDSANVNQNTPDFGMGGTSVKARIARPDAINAGGSHNGAIVKYSVSGTTWTGEVQSDINGFHGAALQTKADVLAGKIAIGK